MIKKAMNDIKIMSFNTQHCENFLTHKIDFSFFADTIRKCNADIVGLQEMRNKGISADYENQLEELSRLSELGYYYFAKAFDVDGKNPYGNGILSRIPIVSAETVLIPEPDPRGYDGYYEQRCLLKAKLENGLTVIVTHFGLNPDELENAVKTVLENLEDEKCVLMGDFNACPENPLLLPIRERMKDTADMFDVPKLSFPSDNPTMKIEYIFVSKDIETVSADIPARVVSDHRPYVAKIGF